MPATDLPDVRLGPAGGLIAAIKGDTLVYIVLNVGDGDCQLILLPADETGQRRLIVVDAIAAKKLVKLIDACDAHQLLGPNGPELELVVATHPHADHIRGIPTVLDTYQASRPEVWDSGYRHASGMFMDIMDRVARYDLRRTVVSGGMSRTIAKARVSVLAPSVALQRQFDTYGVNVNDASVSLKIDYPATQVLKDLDGQTGRTKLTYINQKIGNTLILGADAQMRSWAQVLVDFPQLGPVSTPVTTALQLTGGTNPLRADVFKIPHHGSKHGLTLELVEAVNPSISIVSSGRSGGKYEFPHEVAMAQLREAVNARSSTPGQAHDDDDALILAYTGSVLSGPAGTTGPAGSVCVLCPLAGRPTVWRLMDDVTQDIDLAKARPLL
jgi:beta-lactamase superfamily II metal-dependent hydrolase